MIDAVMLLVGAAALLVVANALALDCSLHTRRVARQRRARRALVKQLARCLSRSSAVLNRLEHEPRESIRALIRRKAAREEAQLRAGLLEDLFVE